MDDDETSLFYPTIASSVIYGYPMNYHVTGAIRLAHSRQRMEEFRHVQSMGRHMGIEFEEMSNSDMQAIIPFLRRMTSAVASAPRR